MIHVIVLEYVNKYAQKIIVPNRFINVIVLIILVLVVTIILLQKKTKQLKKKIA